MKGKPAVPSLKDFSAANPQHHSGKCSICALPQIDEVNEGMRSGIGNTTINRWLMSLGYPNLYSKLAGHRQKAHHLAKESRG